MQPVRGRSHAVVGAVGSDALRGAPWSSSQRSCRRRFSPASRERSKRHRLPISLDQAPSDAARYALEKRERTLARLMHNHLRRRMVVHNNRRPGVQSRHPDSIYDTTFRMPLIEPPSGCAKATTLDRVEVPGVRGSDEPGARPPNSVSWASRTLVWSIATATAGSAWIGPSQCSLTATRSRIEAPGGARHVALSCFTNGGRR